MHAGRPIRHVHQVIQKTRKRRRKIAGDGGTNGSHGLRDKRNQVLSLRACIAIVQEQEPDVSRRSHNTWGTSLPSVSHASIVQFFSFSSRRFPFSFVTTCFHVGNCSWINGKRGIKSLLWMVWVYFDVCCAIPIVWFGNLVFLVYHYLFIIH